MPDSSGRMGLGVLECVRMCCLLEMLFTFLRLPDIPLLFKHFIVVDRCLCILFVDITVDKSSVLFCSFDERAIKH